jgi:hypothetical protein
MEEYQLKSIVELIAKELIQIYQIEAQYYEKGEMQNINDALYFYEKCLQVILPS